MALALPHSLRMKYCYSDIDSDSNLDQVKAKYESTFSALRSRFPSLKFFHVTRLMTELPIWRSNPMASGQLSVTG